MPVCEHCGEGCDDRELVKIGRKWVPGGRGPEYKLPVIFHCHKACKSAFMDDRAKYFAVMDETMNTHRDFVRESGQDGYVEHEGKRIPCKGWQSAADLGVPYIPAPRYEPYY